MVQQNSSGGRVLSPDLPADNYVSRYMQYGRRLTDAYPEWHFVSAVSQLAVVADRKLVVRLAHGDIYPNMYFIGLGDSTISRKSTGMNIASSVMAAMGLEEARLPNSFSPESFIECMADRPHAYLWLDEAGSMLAAMQKAYMNDMRDLFCDLYECRSYRRTLRTSQRRSSRTDFNVEDPYLNQWLLTTPDVFKANTTTLDATSGWLVRYLFVNPEYDKEWRGFRKRTDEDVASWGQVVGTLHQKKTLIEQRNAEIEMELTDEAWEFYEQWQREQEEIALQKKDRVVLAILGRVEVQAIKMAMLFEFGARGFTAENAHINLWSIRESCRLMTGYFMPVAKDIVMQLEWDEQKNLIEKILGTLRRAGGQMPRRVLLRRLHKPMKDIRDAIESLLESGEISVTTERPYTVTLTDSREDTTISGTQETVVDTGVTEKTDCIQCPSVPVTQGSVYNVTKSGTDTENSVEGGTTVYGTEDTKGIKDIDCIVGISIDTNNTPDTPVDAKTAATYLSAQYDRFNRPDTRKDLARLKSSMITNLSSEFAALSQDMTEHIVDNYCRARGWE